MTSTTHDLLSAPHFKDLAIKLFGRTIPLPESKVSAALLNLDGCNNLKEEKQVRNKEELEVHLKEEQGDGNEERVLKKPDKIIPCPRCNSLETKFCYFNNYNVNQPRHFCKNCQRYWTAGGTMRNVPIGAGRRRNKQLASQYRHIIVSSSSSEGLATSRFETSDSTNHHQFISGLESPAFRPSNANANATLLKFGPDAPLCESMETVLSLGDHKRSIEIGSAYSRDSPEEPSSCGSSMTTNELPKTVVEREAAILSGSSNENASPNTIRCYPVPQLVFPLNQGGNSIVSSAMAKSSDSTSVSNQVQWLPAKMLAVPGYCTPSLPLQFVPASYWGCTPVWTAAGVRASQTSAASIGSCATSSSPTLGKHSRDANSLTEEEESEKCVVVPKTVRVDKVSEGSRSPIWTTFESSESNADGKEHYREAPHLLEAKTGSFYL